ncbi:MAG: hypothetical protein HWE22_08535 [Flavobacteriales bacterium]|nr:hypothetical protein [Flavobacteriales bacterium]
MNLTTSHTALNTELLLAWFFTSIESLDQFSEYEQLQLIICASELGYVHPNIDRKVSEIAGKEESQSMDYVVQFLEQLVMMNYQVGQERQQHFFDFWISQENLRTQSPVTMGYLYGYVLMKENELSSPALKNEAIQWLKENDALPSLSFTAWTVFYLDQNNERPEAKKRFDELMSLRMENGSWNNFPKQTIQIAYPLSLTSFANDQSLQKTKEFILAQSWEGFSGEIPYEIGLIKWLNSHGLIQV